MMTVITEIEIEPGQEPRWDEAFHQRFREASRQPGWVSVELLIPVDAPNKRVVVGTWQSRADWEAWHQDPAFEQTRQRMQGLEEGTAENWWHEVLEDVRRSA